MIDHYAIGVELTLLGPILTRAGRMTEPGTDAPMARDAIGRFMLPYSLVKGKVLDAFRDLRPHEFAGTKPWWPTSADMIAWLGKNPGDGSWEPERGRLRFSDFVTEQKGRDPSDDHDAVIERVRIDAETGAASNRMLVMIEAPFGYDEPVTFAGRVEFLADAAEAERIRADLHAALRWVASYGAMRTIGFGRTHAVVTELTRREPTAIGLPAAATVLPFRLRPDRPLCLVGPKHSRNHFDSLDTISGTVLKGALARLVLELNGSNETVVRSDRAYPRFGAVARHLSALRLAEARPMPAGAATRPVIPPLSLVTAPTRPGEFFDAALSPDAVLIDDKCPSFAVDWKYEDEKAVRAMFGVPELPRERRTRTAIDRSTGRAADQQLFSYGLVPPERRRDDGTTDQYVWEGAVGLEGVPEEDRPAVRRELAELLRHGLPNIGKTRATADVTWLAAPTPARVAGGVIHDPMTRVVTLQTDCLMTEPDVLTDPSPEPLHRAYAAFWAEVSGGALELSHYFARQTLHGGFVAGRAGRNKYEPFLVTDRGSVFVLTVRDAAAAGACLDRWRGGGLDTPAWVADRYREPLWKTCPFVREAGYGEVAVDLACHHEWDVRAAGGVS